MGIRVQGLPRRTGHGVGGNVRQAPCYCNSAHIAAMAKAPAQHKRKSLGASHTKPRKHSATDKRRGSARDRGYSTRWDQFSKQFRRANPLCEFCLAAGRYVPSEVTDHDLPHRGDPDLFWENTFTALCRSCHDGPKARAEARYSGDDLLRWVARRKKIK